MRAEQLQRIIRTYLIEWVGLNQLKKINLFIKKREKIAKKYEKEFKKISSQIDYLPVDKIKNSWHLYVINLKFKSLSKKDYFFKFLKKNKVIAQYHYIPIYRFSVGRKYKQLPGCEKFYKSAISIPIFVGLKVSEQIKVIKLIKDFLKKIN